MEPGEAHPLLLYSLFLLAGESAIEFSSGRALKAQKTYQETMERLKSEYESKVTKAKAEYLKSLEAALTEVRKTKNSGEAAKISRAIEELKKEGVTSSKTSQSPGRVPEKTGEYSFEGGDGDSLDHAVIIKGAEDSVGAVDAEGLWLRKHFPKLKKKGQALLKGKGKAYDRIELSGPNGEAKEVYFDNTECFGFPKG